MVESVNAPNLKVQMDLYHCQIVEGDVSANLRRYLPTGRVGHLQIAGVPLRHEPDQGELNYSWIYALLRAGLSRLDRLRIPAGRRRRMAWAGWPPPRVSAPDRNHGHSNPCVIARRLAHACVARPWRANIINMLIKYGPSRP